MDSKLRHVESRALVPDVSQLPGTEPLRLARHASHSVTLGHKVRRGGGGEFPGFVFHVHMFRLGMYCYIQHKYRPRGGERN
jgi:hypothetical protein